MKEEKIKNILEKDFITDSDKILLNKYLSENENSKSLQSVLNYLLDDKSDHIPDFLWSDIVLLKNKQITSNISNLLFNNLENHLQECTKCKEIYNELSNEFDNISDFLDEKITNPVESIQPIRKQSILDYFLFPKFQMAFGAAALLILVMFVFPPIFNMQISSIENLASNSIKTTRGRLTKEFNEAMQYYKNREYIKAVQKFDDDINTNNDELTLFYTYYLKGLVLLKASEENSYLLFNTYNNQLLMKAYQSFNLAIEKNSEGYFDNIKGKSYLFAGYIKYLLDDYKQSRSLLGKSIELNPKLSKKAEAILAELK